MPPVEQYIGPLPIPHPSLRRDHRQATVLCDKINQAKVEAGDVAFSRLNVGVCYNTRVL